jgi:hypothetical protein
MSSFALTTSTRKLAFLAAVVLALGVGHDLLHMPLQIGDSLAPLLDAVRGSSPWSEFTAHLREDGYFRPMRLATIKVVSDLANGHYFLAYRLFHALLVLAFLLLFVRALEVRDRLALAVVPLALTVFVGLHTFLGTVKEIYPTNHFLQIAVLALLALNLAQSRGGLLVDALLFLTFTAAALTLESGLLVWVVIVAAWISGMPGVSRRSVVGVTALLAGYFVLRFWIFGTGLPTVEERSTGFLLEALDPPQIRERFGDNLLPLYAYNVASSISSVLFSEPRSGVWVLVRAIRGGEIAPRHFIQIVASLFATGLLLAYVVARLRSGVRRPATLADQHTVIFALVLAANAAMSYVYTKDEIMSTAGAFYALAVAGAAVYFLRAWTWPEGAWSRPATAIICVVCLAGSAAWAIRAAGVHHVLRSQAFVQRNDWTRLDREWKRDGNWERYRAQEALVRELQREAIATRVVNPRFEPRWMERVFYINY